MRVFIHVIAYLFFCCSFYLLPDQKMSNVPLSFCVLISSVLSAALDWLIVSVWLCSRGPIDYIMLLMYASLSQDSAGITTCPRFQKWPICNNVVGSFLIQDQNNIILYIILIHIGHFPPSPIFKFTNGSLSGFFGPFIEVYDILDGLLP